MPLYAPRHMLSQPKEIARKLIFRLSQGGEDRTQTLIFHEGTLFSLYHQKCSCFATDFWQNYEIIAAVCEKDLTVACILITVWIYSAAAVRNHASQINWGPFHPHRLWVVKGFSAHPSKTHKWTLQSPFHLILRGTGRRNAYILYHQCTSASLQQLSLLMRGWREWGKKHI